MSTVKTLQERLEKKARMRADLDAQYAVFGLPKFECITTWARHNNSDMKVVANEYHVRDALKLAISDQLYQQYLREETLKVLEAADKDTKNNDDLQD